MNKTCQNSSDIKKFYLYLFLKNFAFIYAVYILLFEIRGQSVFEISLLLGIWSGFVVLFEVPAGLLADKWNKKKMLISGLISKAIGFTIWIYSDHFLSFALGFLFWGIEETFSSGTQEALLYEMIPEDNIDDMYEEITGKGHFYSQLGTGISIFFGGFIASYSFQLTAALSAVFMLLAVIPIMMLNTNPQKILNDKEKESITIKNSFNYIMKKPFILKLFLFSAVVITVLGVLEEYEQIYFHFLGLPVSFFGIIMVIIMLVQAYAGKTAFRFKNFFYHEKSYSILSLIGGLLLILSVLSNSLLLLIPFILFFYIVSISEIYIESGLQKAIKVNERATILSFHSLTVNLSAIGLTFIFGLFSKFFHLQWGFVFFGMILIVFSIFAFLFYNHSKQSTETT